MSLPLFFSKTRKAIGVRVKNGNGEILRLLQLPAKLIGDLIMAERADHEASSTSTGLQCNEKQFNLGLI
jgi:hypothetical protein